jgi:ADP-ribosyl-[dinitrogen reductase] hydrolase
LRGAPDFEFAFRIPEGFRLANGYYPDDLLCGYTSVPSPPDEVDELIGRIGRLDGPEDRAIGCHLGNQVGDALGAPLALVPVRYGVEELDRSGFARVEVWARRHNAVDVAPGQWTDEFALATCLAESLLCRGELVPIDLRMRFYQWWALGYGNAFALDRERPSRGSVGLGHALCESLQEFEQTRTEYTERGSAAVSNNGSLARVSPVPVAYWRTPERAMDVALDQSRTTHRGVEAGEACRLLTWLCAAAIRTGDRAVLEALDDFPTEVQRVRALARGEGDWGWRWPDHRYGSVASPRHAGRYALDALAMALHCVHRTDDFAGAVLAAVNLGGDADAVGAITGQIAGAIYGASAIPEAWRAAVRRWDGGRAAWRAHLLFHRFA